MIPYILVEPIPIGPLTLQPFGLLVATGVLLGSHLATKRAERLGLDVHALRSFVGWMLVFGFIGAHVLDTVFYHPHEIARRPWSLLFLWEGLSSFGGFAGALVGVLLWRRYRLVPFKAGPFELVRFARRERPEPILPFVDVVLAVFPVAWIFGRTGCAVVHDHPGALAPKDALFAVAYGPGPVEPIGPLLLRGGTAPLLALRHGSTPRWDLGLIEMLFTVVVALAFAATWRRKLPLGSYVAASAIAYAPIRFVLDFLRAPAADGGDIRWAGLTAAQWACIALFVFGLAMARRIARNPVVAAPSANASDGTGGGEASADPAASPAS